MSDKKDETYSSNRLVNELLKDIGEKPSDDESAPFSASSMGDDEFASHVKRTFGVRL